MDFHRVYSEKTDRHIDIIFDQTIAFRWFLHEPRLTLCYKYCQSLFEKMPLQQAFPGIDTSSDTVTANNQLNPFKF